MEQSPAGAASPSTRRLKLTIAYDGASWLGWQTLPSGLTVQDQMEAAFEKIAGSPVRVHGSGRTDAGVHAVGQVAHGDVPHESKLTCPDWTRALNAVLPCSIRVMRTESVHAGFHARYDAKAKLYRYRIWRGDVMSPFEAGRAWHVFGPLDMDAMRRCASLLPGRHDFSRLSANRGSTSDENRRASPENVIRTLYRTEVLEGEDGLTLEFEGDGFLYRMVRLIVGSLVHVARGRGSEAWFASLLAAPEGVKSHRMAPADGLYLVGVKYQDNAGQHVHQGGTTDAEV